MALPQTDEEVRLWLANLEMTGCLDAFLEADWRGEKLLELNREELADLGVPKAQRNLVMLAVEALRQGDAPPTLADAKAPTYAPALTEQATAACRELGLHPPAPWVDAVSEQWPGPIAHEYQRLRDVLAQGQIVAAIFQLRDLAEVLVKFPALVMARDLIEHGDAAAAREARKSLFGGLLSMGHWVGRIAGGTLAAEMARVRKDHDLLLPELADWFGAGDRNQAAWVAVLKKLVEWRNTNLGHGVFRLNPQEYLPELIEAVGAINRQLAAQVAQGLWAEVRLCGAEAVTLTGWQTIRHWHDGPAGAAHLEQEAPLWLEKGGRTLQLAPLAMLRRCTVCARQDVFLYDSLGGHSLRDGFTLLDYLSGHRLSLPIHRATTLHAEAQAVADSPAAPVVANDTAKPDEDYGDSIVNEMLEAKLLAARYLRPDYLREPLRAFVDTNERGVFWLTAPSHTGKSVFTHGLAFPAEMGDKPLWPTPATAVVVLHIRREFKTWPEQLREFMRSTVLVKTFKREAGRLALPELDVKAADPAAAFATLLQASFQLKPAFIERLVLILDGLDELPASPEGKSGIAGFIPQPDALPPGCFLLLTSRPLPDCPPHIRRALADRFSGCAAFGAYALDFAQTGSTAYFQLLRAYFDRELADRLKQEAYQALVDFVAGRAEVVCRNDLSRVQPPALAALLKEEWQQLTAAVRVRSPQDAPGLLETVVQPVLARYDAAFAEVCQKATDRFLYVAHLTDLLRDGQLALTEVGALPVGAGLYAHYLRQLERAVVGRDAAQTGNRGEEHKLWAFVQRVILTLAAAEQAHVAFQQMLPVSVRDEVFRGVPLGILAALLDEPGRTLRLTFTLYSLKTILAVWKGEDSQDAHYALGLKDFTGAVAALWPEALQQTHRLLANQTLEALEGRWETVTDDEPLDQWRLQYYLAHIRKLEEIKSAIGEKNDIEYENLIIKVFRNKFNYLIVCRKFSRFEFNSRRNYRRAMIWISLAISYYFRLNFLKRPQEITSWVSLAYLYEIRSTYNWLLNNKNESILDLDKCIKIFDYLYDFFGDELGFNAKIYLSSSLLNKVIKLQKLGINDTAKAVFYLDKISAILNPKKIEDDYGLSRMLFGDNNLFSLLSRYNEWPSWPDPSSLSFINIAKAAISRLKVFYSNLLTNKKYPINKKEVLNAFLVLETSRGKCTSDWGSDTMYTYCRVIYEYTLLRSVYSGGTGSTITISADVFLSSVIFRDHKVIIPTLIEVADKAESFFRLVYKGRYFKENLVEVKDVIINIYNVIIDISYYAYDLYKVNDGEKAIFHLDIALQYGEKALKNNDFLTFNRKVDVIDSIVKICILYIERAMYNKMTLASDIIRAIELYELHLSNLDILTPHEKMSISKAYKEKALFSLNYEDAIFAIEKSLKILISLRDELEKIGLWSENERRIMINTEKVHADLLKNIYTQNIIYTSNPPERRINIKNLILMALSNFVCIIIDIIITPVSLISKIKNLIILFRFIISYRKRVKKESNTISCDSVSELYKEIKHHRTLYINKNHLDSNLALQAILYYKYCLEIAKKDGDHIAELEAKRSIYYMKTEMSIGLDDKTILFLLSTQKQDN